MARKARPLEVLFSGRSRRDLDAIWIWTAKAFGGDHADRYLEFLIGQALALESDRNLDRPLKTDSSLFFRTFRRRKGGHGHVAVFTISEGQVEIVHFFHTSQDWIGMCDSETDS